jgi:hypothetical protein
VIQGVWRGDRFSGCMYVGFDEMMLVKLIILLSNRDYSCRCCGLFGLPLEVYCSGSGCLANMEARTHNINGHSEPILLILI